MQRLGAQAKAQTRARLKKVPAEKSPPRPATDLAILLLDAYLMRFRGPGKASSWRWGVDGTGKPCATDWDEPGPCWPWPMEHPGSGASSRIVGRTRTNCWTSIMPANTCGPWVKPCLRRTRQRGINESKINSTQLRHGKEKRVLQQIAALRRRGAERGVK